MKNIFSSWYNALYKGKSISIDYC